MSVSQTVHNERRKTEAAWLNNVGVAFVAVVGVTPGIAVIYHLATAPEFTRWTTIAFPFVCVFIGSGFNRLACLVLRTVV